MIASEVTRLITLTIGVSNLITSEVANILTLKECIWPSSNMITSKVTSLITLTTLENKQSGEPNSPNNIGFA